MKQLKILSITLLTLVNLPLMAFCPCCDQEPPPCTCDTPYSAEIDTCDDDEIIFDDECQCDIKTLLYVKGGARWYPNLKTTWPTIGLGWRCYRTHAGFDLSVSTSHPTMNFADFKHYYNVNVKAMGLYVLCPNQWSTPYWGAGIGMDHHNLHDHIKNTTGTLEGCLGYEFPFANCTRGFLQLEASQPIYGRKGFHWYRTTSVSLVMGVGF